MLLDVIAEVLCLFGLRLMSIATPETSVPQESACPIRLAEYASMSAYAFR